MTQHQQNLPETDVLQNGQNNNADELALLAKIVARNRNALSELFVVYHDRLFKFVFRLTNSYTVADELVNDVLMVVWNKAATFRGESKVSTWIFGIAYRLTMRRVSRKQLRTTQLSETDVSHHSYEQFHETEDWVAQALARLPAAHRMTVVLVFYLGLTYEETAKVANCPVNTIKTRMFHARRKLRGILDSSADPCAVPPNVTNNR